MLDCNTYHPAMLLRMFLPRLEGRKSHSGVIMTSSVASELAIPRSLAYSCSKVFERYLCKSVNFELNQAVSKVDLLCLKPGVVITKMGAIAADMPGSVLTDACVSGALRDLGQEEESNGPLIHQGIGKLLRFYAKYAPKLGMIQADKA